MVFINTTTRQIAAKIVYYGPGLSGKTTNLEWIYKHTDPQSRGEMVSLETETDRTLFFDLLPIEVGLVGGFRTKFQLYTVPGQVFYNSTRKMVLRGVDGIVFVADSQKAMMDANLDSLKNLYDNLRELEYDPDEIPLVFQYNKRDLKNIASIRTLNRRLNKSGAPHIEAVAVEGVGVFETLKEISKLTLKSIRKKAATAATARRTVVTLPGKPKPSRAPQISPGTVLQAHPGAGASPSPATSPALSTLPAMEEAAEENVEFAEVQTPAVESKPIRMKKVALRSIQDIERELNRIRQEVLKGSTDKKNRRAPTQTAHQAVILAPTTEPGKREIRKHIRIRLSPRDLEAARRIGIDLNVLGKNIQKVFRAVMQAELEPFDEGKAVVVVIEIDLVPKTQ